MRPRIHFQLDEELPTDLKKVNPFIERIYGKILSLAGSQEDASKIKLVLEEAITNAMRHGNKLERSTIVKVSIVADKKKIELDVHDMGGGFDFRNLSDPTKKDGVQKPSGRGVFLMRKFMDKVKFYDGGSGVRMLRKFKERP